MAISNWFELTTHFLTFYCDPYFLSQIRIFIYLYVYIIYMLCVCLYVCVGACISAHVRASIFVHASQI